MPKQRFIPFSRHDVEEICRATQFVTPKVFGQHCQLFNALVNMQYHQVLEQLKLAYGPHNPDLDTKPLPSQASLQASDSSESVDLTVLITKVLEAANYERLSEDDLLQAMSEESMCNIRLDIDFNEFSQLLVFARGEHQINRVVARLGRFGKKKVEFVNFERVFIFLQFQPRQWFIDRKRPVPEHIEPGAIMLKLFKDVPKADLETLFPNTKIKMRTLDKLLIGVPAIASGGVILATKLGATMVLVTALVSFSLGWSDKVIILDQKNLLILAAGLATLGGYLWKQFSVFKNRKILFMKTLADSLYYKALDNNVGVFHYLIDNAKESEVKELILAWTFMHKLKRATAQQLDQAIEQYFVDNLDCAIDFDVEDALDKLKQFNLVSEDDHEYVITPSDSSLSHLMQQWQGLVIPIPLN